MVVAFLVNMVLLNMSKPHSAKSEHHPYLIYLWDLLLGLKLIPFSCSRMKGVPLGASTCRSGSCIAMACLKGYALIDGSCELD